MEKYLQIRLFLISLILTQCCQFFWNVRSPNLAAAQELALSFDDSPHPDAKLYSGTARARKIAEALERSGNIHAVFFSISGILTKEGLQRLRFYSSRGHLIANHSDRHISFDSATYDSYLADFIEADRILSQFSTFRKWFRFPFLREGKTVEDRNRFRNELSERGYRNGYVTVDSADWFIDELLQEGLKAGKKLDQRALCGIYSTALLDGLTFYDQLALKVLGRSPKHVLLLHEYDVAALCLPSLLKMLRINRWNIIDPQIAYSDPISMSEPDTLFCHQGRIAAIASVAGIPPEHLVSRWEDKHQIKAAFETEGVFK